MPKAIPGTKMRREKQERTMFLLRLDLLKQILLGLIVFGLFDRQIVS